MRWILLIIFAFPATIHSNSSECKQIGKTGFLEFSEDGDLNIGGAFTMVIATVSEYFDYRAVPQIRCNSRNDRELKFARTLIFTVEEINRNPRLLPGVKLGYRIYNACGTNNLLRATLEFVNEDEQGKQNCGNRILALLGHSSSGPSQHINQLISPFFIPQISHLATCACLSDKKQYPSFFRTVPSDHFQVLALLQLMKYYDWQWVGIIYSIGTYSVKAKDVFIEEAKKEGICIEYLAYFLKKYTTELNDIENTIKHSTSTVVLLIMSLSYARNFLAKMEGRKIVGKQWIGTESWITTNALASAKRQSVLQGAMGFAIPATEIPGLSEFLLSLHPSDYPKSNQVKLFWEGVFGCSLSSSNTSKMCDGTEDLRNVYNDYTDTNESRTVHNVYKSVYVAAHALQDLLQCQNGSNPLTGDICVNKTDVQPKMVLKFMKLVNFTTPTGEKIFFDENGDSVAEYDLVNWQMREDGSVNIVNIGRYDASLPKGQKLKLQKNVKIVWGGNSLEVPRSVCKEPCQPGTRKSMNKNRPVCCFDCVECPDGTISNVSDSPACLTCPPELWSNEDKDQCVSKPNEYLSFEEIMGTLLTLFSILGVFMSFVTTVIFWVHRETPIVRSNNSELSFLLLFSLKLCFLCSMTFIGKPTEWSCMLRHTAFGITFVLCVSCVLGKTLDVLMAFKATLPGSNIMKWFGPNQQRLSVLSLTSIQVIICIIWLKTSPPFPNRNMKYYKEKIILECALGSPIGFWAVLGYIGLLALLCFVLAFLARKLPDNFNEAKFISFSMFICCAVWITFIPAYISSPGKFTVAVEIFAILASSFSLLICIFIPKCCVIIFKPELNSRKTIMGQCNTKYISSP